MAHLEVEPKPARPWWIWLLLAIIVIALAALLFRGCGNDGKSTGADSTGTDSTATKTIAATGPDWNSVDFNAAATKDPDITDSDIAVRGNETYTIYSLGENILFPVDQNVIQESGSKKLEMISNVVKKKFPNATIGVFGSTDSTGTAGHNKELGKERAEAVKTWLTANGGINTENVSVRSLGETKPVATNATADGRAQNRNVSIVVFPAQ